MDYDFLPCSNNPDTKCATCELHGNGCPVEEDMEAAKSAYNVIKSVYPAHAVLKAGVDIKELVKAKNPDYYNYFNKYFDWTDIDGILDFLYFHSEYLHIAEAQSLIDLIEANCEVK